MFGTPSGRMDHAYLARVEESEFLNKQEYAYWNGNEWIKDKEEVAIPVIDTPVSELTVVYNSYYNKWIMVYLNENRYAMVMRSSGNLTHGWSPETEIATGAEFPGLYGGYIHPWTNDGQDLYFLMSEWGPYNVVLMKSELKEGDPKPNLISDPSFEDQSTEEIAEPWSLENGEGGVDVDSNHSRSGSNNAYLRNDTGWNGLTQKITVKPNTKYRLHGFIRTSQNNNAGYFGIRDVNGEILKEQKFDRHDNYKKLIVEFDSGNNDFVTVFTGMHANGDTWVQMDDYLLVEVDTNPPEITLNGESTIEIPLGGDFSDPGATAFDYLDGDITDKIEVSGEVNTNIVGNYLLTYNVTDYDGNQAKKSGT